MPNSSDNHSLEGVDSGHAVTDAWNRYWSGGQLASCFGDSQGQYSGPIAQLWKDFLAVLPDRCRLLDVAAGNGAIALMAVQAGLEQHKEFDVHAVDLAEINPLADLASVAEQMADIHFHPRTPAEQLPFDDSYFDVVMSQYGFEYTRVPATVLELARVARPRGRLQLVVHAREGSVYTASGHTRTVISRLLEETAILDIARAMVEQVMILERSSGPVTTGEEKRFFDLRQRYEQVVDTLQREIQDANSQPMVANVIAVIHHAFNHRGDFQQQEILRKLDELETELRCHDARLGALMQAAMGQGDLDSLQRELGQAGFVESGCKPVLDSSRGLIAYAIAARRSA